MTDNCSLLKIGSGVIVWAGTSCCGSTPPSVLRRIWLQKRSAAWGSWASLVTAVCTSVEMAAMFVQFIVSSFLFVFVFAILETSKIKQLNNNDNDLHIFNVQTLILVTRCKNIWMLCFQQDCLLYTQCLYTMLLNEEVKPKAKSLSVDWTVSSDCDVETPDLKQLQDGNVCQLTENVLFSSINSQPG